MEDTWRELKARWLDGNRERDLALPLLFHAWMHWADPSFVTGMTEDGDAVRIWREVYLGFGGEDSSDVEFLYVASIMTGVAPWALGDERVWRTRSERLKDRALKLRPQGFAPRDFEGRGAYGEYFAHQASRT